MIELGIAAALVVAVIAWFLRRPLRVYNVSAGVRHNMKLLTDKLNAAGIRYEAEVPADGTVMWDTTESASGSALRLRRVNVEVALGLIRVWQIVEPATGSEKVRKCVSVSGFNYPYPRITLAMAPPHCWGFDPFALTSFNRDPRFGQIEYEKRDIEPNSIPSMTLPGRILDIAVAYLTHEVPVNLYEIWHESD
jgi:hypothetical protein